MIIRSVLLAVAMLGGSAAAGAVEPAAALVLLIGDQHSAYERTAQLVATVDRLKAENPGLPLAILIDGDTLEYGNVLARRSAGTVDFAMFSALVARAPTVLNLGNHEPEFFDLAETVRRIEATGVKVVTNIVDRSTGRSFALNATTIPLGETAAVIVGLATDDLATYRAAARPGLAIPPPVEWATQNFPGLLAGAPLPIILSHAGIAADRRLLALVPDGTLFAGAHDHLRFIHPFAHGVYVHSGSWNQFLTLAWLRRAPAGTSRWDVEQVRIPADGPADRGLVALIRETRAKYLTPADTAVIGHTAEAMTTPEAARWVAQALRAGTGGDAAFIGNTTFGAGLPAGAVAQTDLDACVRFDGAIFMAEVNGARLQKLLAAANQDEATPFEERHGEFCFATGPAEIVPERTYRIATTDWGAKNTGRYFGAPAIAWREMPGLKLKALATAALAGN
jgi:2',3'-cyclic-nucleotide 2'-phosphodiesterase (5'-nucleotidase family)